MRNFPTSIIAIEVRPKPRSYLDALMRDAENRGPRRKRHVTRARLLAATARVMSVSGYAGLRIADIAAEAGASTATVHAYFADREEAGREVLSGLLRHLYLLDGLAHEGPCGARAATLMIRSHLESLQVDAALVRALTQGVLLDDVLADLAERAARLWRTGLSAVLHGSTEGAPHWADRPGPDVLDLLMAGMPHLAGTSVMTPDALSRLAAEIGRAWVAALDEPQGGGRALTPIKRPGATRSAQGLTRQARG